LDAGAKREGRGGRSMKQTWGLFVLLTTNHRNNKRERRKWPTSK